MPRTRVSKKPLLSTRDTYADESLVGEPVDPSVEIKRLVKEANDEYKFMMQTTKKGWKDLEHSIVAQHEAEMKKLGENMLNMNYNDYIKQFKGGKPDNAVEAFNRGVEQMMVDVQDRMEEQEVDNLMKDVDSEVDQLMQMNVPKTNKKPATQLRGKKKDLLKNPGATLGACLYSSTPLMPPPPANAITPKFDPKKPLQQGSCRKVQRGEILMSMMGSPIVNEFARPSILKPQDDSSRVFSKLDNLTVDELSGDKPLLDADTKAKLEAIRRKMDAILS